MTLELMRVRNGMDTFDAGLKTGLGVGHDAVLLMVVWMMMIRETRGAKLGCAMFPLLGINECKIYIQFSRGNLLVHSYLLQITPGIPIILFL